MQNLIELQYEITELRSEISRHHRDFEAIRKILDDEYHDIYSLRLAIRNVVG